MFGFLNKKKKVDEANVRDFDSSVIYSSFQLG